MLDRSIQPVYGPRYYKTYQILAPKSTHFRKASCEEVECQHYLRGWVTTIDEGSDLGQKQAHYIRKMSGRSFREERNAAGLTVFTFKPNQPCFKEHHARVERPEHFLVRPGDFRSLGRPVQHTRPEFWVEDFAEHQDRIKTVHERG